MKWNDTYGTLNLKSDSNEIFLDNFTFNQLRFSLYFSMHTYISFSFLFVSLGGEFKPNSLLYLHEWINEWRMKERKNEDKKNGTHCYADRFFFSVVFFLSAFLRFMLFLFTLFVPEYRFGTVCHGIHFFVVRFVNFVKKITLKHAHKSI